MNTRLREIFSSIKKGIQFNYEEIQNMFDNRIINLENYINKCKDTTIYIKSLEDKGWNKIQNKNKNI